MAEPIAAPRGTGVPSAQARSSAVVLRTHQLTRRYGERLAVDHLALEVRRGEVFGFLGPNGAGKTTTIRMILGLIAPTAGSIEILGQAVGVHRPGALPRVGALVETPALHPYMSARDNLLAIAYVLGGVPAPRLDTVLHLVGLAARQHDRVRTYSLGMKQRLGLAVALLNDPALLILDEPANGLDPAGIVKMRDLLRALAAQGKTIFLSSHVLHEVRQLCTRVAIIGQGRLITETSVEDLVAGHGEFAVWVEQPTDVLLLLRAQPWGQSARLDVALLDLLMPKVDGVTAVREIKRITPSTQVIVLTSYHEDDQIFGMIKAGALSYLLKDTSPEELVAAVRAAIHGESKLHPMVAARVLREVQRRDQSPLAELTPREVDVLTLIARGRSNNEIANALGVGERTVKTHVSNILSKLHLADRTQAAIYALQQRLVPLKDALEQD